MRYFFPSKFSDHLNYLNGFWPKSKNLGSPPPAPPGTPEKSPTSYSSRALSSLKGTVPSLVPAVLNQSLSVLLNRNQKVNKTAPDLSPIKDEGESSLDFSNPGLSSTLTGPASNDLILEETNEIEVFERSQADYHQFEQSEIVEDVIEDSDKVHKIDLVLDAITFCVSYFWKLFKNIATNVFDATSFCFLFWTILSYGFTKDFILLPIWNALPENTFKSWLCYFSQPWIWILSKLAEFQEKFTLNGRIMNFVLTPIWNALYKSLFLLLTYLPFSQPFIWILNKLTEFQEKFVLKGITLTDYFSTKLFNFDMFFQNIRKTK